jgi:hypothetical protein
MAACAFRHKSEMPPLFERSVRWQRRLQALQPQTPLATTQTDRQHAITADIKLPTT